MTKTVLITGCASGIGALAARLFADRGWNVAATARRRDAVPALTGPGVLALHLDVTDETTIARAVAEATDRFGAIDVLVNNAGYGIFGPLEGISAGELQRIFDVNVLGMAAMIRHVLPGMRQRRSGTIVNVSSIGGRMVGSAFMSAYYATKFAVEGLSESLRFELQPHGVRVKLIEPGHFKTDFVERSLQWAPHSAYEPQASNMKAWVIHSDHTAPSAEPVARAIFTAATDRSDRLRYPVKSRLMLAAHALLPDAAWRSVIAAGMTRRPRARSENKAIR
jgi:NAD(P)-dependent dehydrogenase (short-subunit alcohol dehydrogenase family)